jgi:hypothetical protein
MARIASLWVSVFNKINHYCYPFLVVKSSQVTLQLTVRQSVCLGVEPNLGLLTRDIFFKLQSCLIWGALSDERPGLSFVSLLSL